MQTKIELEVVEEEIDWKEVSSIEDPELDAFWIGKEEISLKSPKKEIERCSQKTIPQAEENRVDSKENVDLKLCYLYGLLEAPFYKLQSELPDSIYGDSKQMKEHLKQYCLKKELILHSNFSKQYQSGIHR